MNIDRYLHGIEIVQWLADTNIAVVCGGRDFFPEPEHETALRDILRAYQPRRVFHGACRGADLWAGHVARDMGFRVREFPAAWSVYGASAGPMRNMEMAKAASGGICIAFPGDTGTAGMIRLARKHRVYVIDLRGE